MSKMKAILASTVLVASIACAPVVFAKHSNDVTDGFESGFFNKLMFMMMDKDGDGKLSKDEFMKMAEMEWTMLDKDKSGDISNKEFSDGAADGFFKMKMFAMMDKDKSKKISKGEFMKMMEDKFKMMDKNGDGWLSPEEFLGRELKKSDG